MKKYGKFAVLIVVVIGTLVWLAAAGMTETKTYYKTISEVGQMGGQAQGKRLRVAGDVAGGSIQRKGGKVEFDTGAGEPQAEGLLHRKRSRCPIRSAMAPKPWRTANWALTGSSRPTKSRPNAPPSMKPNRGR